LRLVAFVENVIYIKGFYLVQIHISASPPAITKGIALEWLVCEEITFIYKQIRCVNLAF